MLREPFGMVCICTSLVAGRVHGREERYRLRSAAKWAASHASINAIDIGSFAHVFLVFKDKPRLRVLTGDVDGLVATGDVLPFELERLPVESDRCLVSASISSRETLAEGREIGVASSRSSTNFEDVIVVCVKV